MSLGFSLLFLLIFVGGGVCVILLTLVTSGEWGRMREERQWRKENKSKNSQDSESSKAEVTAENNNNEIPAENSASYHLLCKACQNQDIFEIELSLSLGADVTEPNKDGWTPLHEAVYCGNKEILELLISRKSEQINVSSLLISLPENDREKMGKLLIEAGLDINAKDCCGDTTLSWALQNGEVTLAKQLISLGADSPDMARAIALLLKGGHKEMLKLYLDAGFDVNSIIDYGETALILAFQRGQTEIVKMLIESGADVNAKNKDGETALAVEVLGPQVEIVEMLIAAGADVNAKNKAGETALAVAVERDRNEIAKMLIAAGADIDDKDGRRNTVLTIALQRGNKEIIKILSDKTLSINTKDNNDSDGDFNELNPKTDEELVSVVWECYSGSTIEQSTELTANEINNMRLEEFSNFYISTYTCPFCDTRMHKTVLTGSQAIFVQHGTILINRIFICTSCRIFFAAKAGSYLYDDKTYMLKLPSDRFYSFFKFINDMGSTTGREL